MSVEQRWPEVALQQKQGPISAGYKARTGRLMYDARSGAALATLLTVDNSRRFTAVPLAPDHHHPTHRLHGLWHIALDFSVVYYS